MHPSSQGPDLPKARLTAVNPPYGRLALVSGKQTDPSTWTAGGSAPRALEVRQ
jgi:hypothetical protein